ncbi:polysaccharide pyruvyl transferase family protein [Chryseobacterium sp. T1]
MLQKIKGKLLSYYCDYQLNKKLKTLRFSKEKKNIILFQTPTHTNIGDHAIAEAELIFLENKFPDYNLIEVNQSILNHFIIKNKKNVKSEDIIFIHGGGNFGNQYLNEENLRRSIIEAFPDNKIISFPQTIYFTNDDVGKAELKKTQVIIENHAKLYLIAREEVSYHQMKDYFPKTKIILTPDIVLCMEKISQQERKGALLVLRNDAEKILSDKFLHKLYDIVQRDFDKVTVSDMHYHDNIMTAEKRDEVLDYKFQQFRTSEIVITDRLHGMVFAAITGTPCIAFSNYNQKVSGTYEWIKNLPYIRFVKEDIDIEKEIKSLLQETSNELFDPQKYDDYFQKIVDIINE